MTKSAGGARGVGETGATGGDTGATGDTGAPAPVVNPEAAPVVETPAAPEAPAAPEPFAAPRSVVGGSVFQDSAVYDNFWLTHQVRQFDRAPLTGESILTAVAGPSCAAVYGEFLSTQAAQATGYPSPLTTRAELTNNHDAYVNFFDSTSINRNYNG